MRLQSEGQKQSVALALMFSNIQQKHYEKIPAKYWCEDWEAIKEHFENVLTWVSYYELKEATSIIDLAMWKANIKDMGAVSIDERYACRVEVPEPARHAILQYFH